MSPLSEENSSCRTALHSAGLLVTVTDGAVKDVVWINKE